jgi:Holliday junction DNA helicase RuvA
MGQKILGAFAIEDLAKALISGDEKAFSKISGIGPKLASRLTTELKDSPKKLGIDSVYDIKKIDNLGKIANNQTASDALSALENLGYRKHDCLRVIDFLIGDNSKITLENLITSSLRELSKNKF